MGSPQGRRVLRTTSCALLTARRVEDAGALVLELSGEADISTVEMLTEELAQVVALNRDDVVVELSHLTFCDIESAHSIMTARRMTPFTVSGATGTVQRVFDLLGTLQARPEPGRDAIGLATQSAR